MAFVALGLITCTLGGLLYFLYYNRNMSSLRLRERSVRAALERDEEALAELKKALPGLELAKRISLPAKVDDARREYGAELDKMLRASEFPAKKIGINPKPLENRSAAPASKRPPFQRLIF